MAAQQEGQWMIDPTLKDAEIGMHYGDVARDLRLQGTQATANSQLGVGQATAGQWTGAANAVGGGMQTAGAMNSGYWGGWGSPAPTRRGYPTGAGAPGYDYDNSQG
jgi:hypothetical protein